MVRQGLSFAPLLSIGCKAMKSRIAIVGAGQAAAQAVETLRKRGHSGPITLIGDEDLLPYQRPPLSKKYLAGTLERDRLLIRHAAHYLDMAWISGLGSRQWHRSRTTTRGSRGRHRRRIRPPADRHRHRTAIAAARCDLGCVRYLRTAADVERLRAQTGRRPARRDHRRRIYRTRGRRDAAARRGSKSPCSRPPRA